MYQKMSREEREAKYHISLSKEDIRKRTIRDVVLLLVFGIIYYFMVKYSPITPRCYFNELTGLKCPACGVTRMILSLMHFDLRSAFNYNQYLFITSPYMVGEIIYLFYINESKIPMNRVNKIILYVWLVGLIVFGVIRNLI
ncbi:MAG: DUF2752 domain-containing protein [Eubacterium sp.]|nr:DUF2752 domain-containing protein [Eubacterium sp.]